MNVPTTIHLDQAVYWSAAIDKMKFQKRTCTSFIPKERNNDLCVCNYKHCKSEVDQSDTIWNWKRHTKQEITKCYGILPESNGPYLRCDIKTDLEQICLVFFSLWRIAVPGLIMRMVGDPDSIPSIKIEKEILQGVSDAALSSDAWIITSGYKEESIAELIGEVVYNCRIKNPDVNLNAIAVGKWGNIHDCHQLEKRVSEEPSTTKGGHGRYQLELNHTHNIFFDDGTCDSLDTGEFASDLARQVSRGARRRIPLVTVVVGGTLHSLPSIHTDLQREIPVILIAGCGSLGDLLYKYHKLTENQQSSPNEDVNDEEIDQLVDCMDVPMLEEDISCPSSEIQFSEDTKSLRHVLRPLGKSCRNFINDVRKLYLNIRQQEYEALGKRLPAGELLNLNEEKALSKYLYQFANCLMPPLRQHIHIFNIDSSKSLKETIFHAYVEGSLVRLLKTKLIQYALLIARDNLFKTKKKYHKTVDEQVQLAFHWGIGDMEKEQAAATTMIWNDPNNAKKNRSLFIDALSKNLLAFVLNFVKLDIDLNILFGCSRESSFKDTGSWSHKYEYLKELYSNTIRQNHDPLYLLDQISTKINFVEEKDLVTVLKKLVGDFMQPLYGKQTESGADEERLDPEYIYRDIFLWCILTYRLDMAKIFLGQLKTRICSALIACKILKSLATYAPDHFTREALYSNANCFEDYAIGFIRCAYATDKHKACELIMRQINLYGGVTCLQMAIVADGKKFLHEDACQALLTNIWYDKVDPVREQANLFVNICTFGMSQIVMSFLLRRQFRRTNISTSLKSQSRLKSNGINYTNDYGINEPILKQFLHFHNRPIVKFCYSCLGYSIFLLFFSYYMLYNFAPRSKSFPGIHWTEVITVITVTTMFFEEIRQFFCQENRSLTGKILTYFNLSNRISNLCLIAPSYLLFYVGLLLRFTYENPEHFSSARIVMALDLELWFIRSILFIGIVKGLGPKIVMIRKMTSDLFIFIIIIVIFILAYGIASRSLVFYGSIQFSIGNFLRDIIYPTYYFVHGSFDSERTQLESTTDKKTTMATHVIFAFHMLFVNILLLNLLIALFSFTINDIQTQARYVWAYDRCEIIQIYHSRPALFPPFTFLISMIQFSRRSWRKICRKCHQETCLSDEESSHFKMIPFDESVDYAWSEFERYSTNVYVRQLLEDQVNSLAKGMTIDITNSEGMSSNSDELKHIKYLVNNLQDDLENSISDHRSKLETINSIATDLQTRFDQQRREIQDLKISLNWIMMAMVNSKMSESEPPLFSNASRTNSVNQIQQRTVIHRRSNPSSTKSSNRSESPRSQL